MKYIPSFLERVQHTLALESKVGEYTSLQLPWHWATLRYSQAKVIRDIKLTYTVSQVNTFSHSYFREEKENVTYCQLLITFRLLVVLTVKANKCL